MASVGHGSKRPTSAVVTALIPPVALFVGQPVQDNSIVFDATEYIGITRSHWTEKSSRSVCKSRSCRSKFTLLNTPQNCYKCGEVFCKKCLKQTRRLNVFANYDPQGKFYKVCDQCYNSDQQSSGSCRSLMKDFRLYRTAARKQPKGSCRNEWSEAEERLLNGFLAEVNSTSSLVRMVQSLTVSVKGEWTKPHKSVNNETACWYCKKPFEMIFRARHQCSICGAAVCESCSSRDLIVFIPDDVAKAERSGYTGASLRLITVQGAPSVEPDIHEYLRICQGCYKIKRSRQLEDAVDGLRQQKEGGFWSELCPFHDKMLSDQRYIKQSLEKYETLVNSLEDGSGNTGFGSNVQVLSKAQIDLNDLLYEYLKSVSQLKSFKPTSKKSETIFKNMQMATVRFYTESRSLFGELKRGLADYLPADVIEVIQNQVNKKALICVHLLVKQLGLEVLLLADKQLGVMEIAERLADAEQVVTEELKVVLYKLEGDEMSWDAHLEHTNQMMRLSLKDHKLINISTGMVSRSDYVLNEVVDRSCFVLDQISMQLSAKTTQTSYKLVKETIEQVKQDILKFVCGSVETR